MEKAPPQDIKIIRRKTVEEMTGLSRSTIYHLIKKGTFPKQIKLGERNSGWIESEIKDWQISRIRMRDMKK
jgi:prophage regulatory protein